MAVRRSPLVPVLLVLLVLSAWTLPRGRTEEPPGVRQDWARETPPDMVFVPGGEFWMGSDDPEADEEVRPLRRVFVASFYIDRREVTNADYGRFDPSFAVPPGREDHPVTGLTRDQAGAFLRSQGKRLPTSAEWEKAARGTDGRRHPWGNEWREGFCNGGRGPESAPGACRVGLLAPAGSFPRGASPYGCQDMLGNAWEWVAEDHPGPPVRHLLRGGAAGYPRRYLLTYAFALEDPGVT